MSEQQQVRCPECWGKRYAYYPEYDGRGRHLCRFCRGNGWVTLKDEQRYIRYWKMTDATE